MKVRAGQRGFTLIEIILAVTLAVGLIAAALAFYDQAIRARRAITQQIEAICAVRDVMDRITAELRSVSARSPLGESLDGDGEQLRMIVARLPGPAAWVSQDLADQPVPPQQDLRRVTYSIRRTDSGDGQMTIDGLQRTQQKLLTAIEAVEGREISNELIAPDVKFVRLRYWDRSGWSDSWVSQGPPLAVEVTLGLDPLPEGTDPNDYPYETYRRVVYIPASSRRIAGSIVREPGGEGG